MPNCAFLVRSILMNKQEEKEPIKTKICHYRA